MRKSEVPDAWVTATDRNGHMLERREINGKYADVQRRIGRAKADLIALHGRDTYIFVNIYV